MSEIIVYRGWQIEKKWGSYWKGSRKMKWMVHYPDVARALSGYAGNNVNSLEEAQAIVDKRIAEYGTDTQYKGYVTTQTTSEGNFIGVRRGGEFIPTSHVSTDLTEPEKKALGLTAYVPPIQKDVPIGIGKPKVIDTVKIKSKYGVPILLVMVLGFTAFILWFIMRG